MIVTAHTEDFKRGWRVDFSIRDLRRYDNGHLVSIGLIVGEDVSQRTINRWVESGKAVEIDAEKAKHSGCLSRCVLRGDDKCQF